MGVEQEASRLVAALVLAVRDVYKTWIAATCFKECAVSSLALMQVDLIDFSGPAFMTVDNRVAALRLVQKELCDAALFDPSGNTILPCLVLREPHRPAPRRMFRTTCNSIYSQQLGILPGFRKPKALSSGSLLCRTKGFTASLQTQSTVFHFPAIRIHMS